MSQSMKCLFLGDGNIGNLFIFVDNCFVVCLILGKVMGCFSSVFMPCILNIIFTYLCAQVSV